MVEGLSIDEVDMVPIAALLRCSVCGLDGADIECLLGLIAEEEADSKEDVSKFRARERGGDG